MKKHFFFLLLFISTFSLTAQKEQTLLGRPGTRGGFGGMYTLFSQADSDPGGGGGINGAWVANDFFLGGYLQVEAFGQRRGAYRNYDLSLGSTGFWLGYAYPSHKSIHLYTSLKIGWGFAVLTRRDNDPTDNDDISDASLLLIAPEIGAEANLTHWLRLALTGGYRLVNGVNELAVFSNRDFQSPFLSLSLRVGAFGYPRK